MNIMNRGSRILCSTFVVLGLSAFSSSIFASAQQQQLLKKPEKVAMCHLLKNGTYKLILVHAKAVPAHQKKGDILLPAGATDCSAVTPAPAPVPVPAPTPVPPVPVK